MSKTSKGLSARTLGRAQASVSYTSKFRLEQFAINILIILYGKNAKNGWCVIDPDKEWTQDSIEEVNEELLDILNPRL